MDNYNFKQMNAEQLLQAKASLETTLFNMMFIKNYDEVLEKLEECKEEIKVRGLKENE